MHCLCCSWFQAKFQPQAWKIGENPIISKPGLGDACWFKVLTEGLRHLLSEKVAGARLEQGKEFFSLQAKVVLALVRKAWLSVPIWAGPGARR